MVRLVFRPYTQVRRSICTSEPLRASTRVSSSPSSGIVHHLSGRNRCALTRSQPQRDYTARSTVRRRRAPAPAFHSRFAPVGFPLHPKTRAPPALLGPCFKTGRTAATRRQRRSSADGRARASPCRPSLPGEQRSQHTSVDARTAAAAETTGYKLPAQPKPRRTTYPAALVSPRRPR